MIRTLSTLLATATFAVGVTAQVPDGYLMIGIENATPNSGVRMVDPATGVVTPVYSRDTNGTMVRCLGLCPEPTSTGTWYLHGSSSGFLGPDLRPLIFTQENNVHPVPAPLAGWTSLIPAGYPPFSFPQKCTRVTGTNLLATVISGGSNNGLWFVDLSAQTVSSALLLPVNSSNTNGFAEHVAAIGSKVYLVTEASSFGPSVVYEYDTLTATSQVVGVALDLRSAGVVNGTVVVGDATGKLWNVTGGGLMLNLNTMLGLPIVGIASKGGAMDPVYIAVRGTDPMTMNVVDKVYDTTDLVNPIFTFNSSNTFNGISQMWVGTDTAAVNLVFGQGCVSTAATTPRHDFINKPTLGNLTFQIGLTGAPSMAPTVCHIGISRTTSSGGPLPIDLSIIGMPGCNLYTEPVAILPVAVDMAGMGAVLNPIPNNPLFVGAALYSQFAIFDLGANALNVVASDGAEFIVK